MIAAGRLLIGAVPGMSERDEITMIVHLAIIIFSTALFAYWFRCSCLLILNAQTSEDYARSVIDSAQLAVSETLAALREGEGAEVGAMRRSLDNDYARVSGLLDGNESDEGCLSGVERQILSVDYSLMRMKSRVCQAWMPRHATDALLEMGAIVQCFANAAGAAGRA